MKEYYHKATKRLPYLLHHLRAAIAAGITIAAAPCAYGLPEAGVIARGDAVISSHDGQMHIIQHSDRALIDWQAFDVAQGERVTFNQPHQGALAVNRVHGMAPSQINGHVQANGQIVILNEYGVLFGQHGRVDAAALVVSTGRMSNHAFDSGTMQIEAGAIADAAIINHGTLRAKDAGLVGLVAPNVENHGVIEAQMGRVVLASGERATLDLAGDGLIQISMGNDRIADSHVKNHGSIIADGGRVLITAAEARHQIDQLIVNQGVIQANHVAQRDGVIVLSAKGEGAIIEQAGIIRASAAAADAKGGSITMLADKVHVQATSRIDVDGGAGGGTIKVGGGREGVGTSHNAKRVAVEAGSITRANATHQGNGGEVIFWADERMGFAGRVEAKGGALAGDGGFVEVSGKAWLSMHGDVDLSAANGVAGELLLDPGDIVICQFGASSLGACNPSGVPDFDITGSVFDSGAEAISYLNIGAVGVTGSIVDYLQQNISNLTIRTNASGAGNGDITIADALTWTVNRTLTLEAHRDIIVDAPIQSRNITFTVGRDLVLNANLSQTGGATLTIQPLGANHTIGLAGGVGNLNLSVVELDFIQPGWGNIIIGRTNNTAIMDVGAYADWSGPLTLRSGNGQIQINGAQVFSGTSNTVIEGNSIAINDTLTGGGTLTLRPVGNITVGIGAAGAEAWQISDAEIARIQSGFTRLIFGRVNHTQAVNIRAMDWNHHVEFVGGAGLMRVWGAQNFNGNNVWYRGRNLQFDVPISGTGNLQIYPDGDHAMRIGNGAGGTFILNNALLDQIQPGWNLVTLGSGYNQSMTIYDRSWNNPMRFLNGNGVMTFAGPQDFGAFDTIISSNREMVINQPMTGTGILNIRATANNIAMIVAGVGVTQPFITAASLDNIAAGFAGIHLGQTANTSVITLEAYNWNAPVTILSNTGAIAINGAQQMGVHDLTFNINSNPSFNALVDGTGVMRFIPLANASTIQIANNAGTIRLLANDMDNIADGWQALVFGSDSMTGGITIHGYNNWRWPAYFITNSGAITIAQAVDFGAQNVTMQTNANIAINNPLGGSGILHFMTSNPASSIGVAQNAQNLRLQVAALNNIQAGFEEIRIGREDGAGNIVINAYANWSSPLRFITGSGNITVAQANNFNAQPVVFSSDGVIAFNAAVTGTGLLALQATNPALSLGLAGQAANITISNATMNQIGNGFEKVRFGRADMTGELFIPARLWGHATEFMTGTGVIRVLGDQDFGVYHTVFSSNVTPDIMYLLQGSGVLRFQTSDEALDIGLFGQIGNMALDASFMDNIADGFEEIILGRPDATGAIRIGSYAGWRDPVRFQRSLIDGVTAIGLYGNQATLLGSDASLRFDGGVQLMGHYAITTDNQTIYFGSAVDGAYNLTVDAGTSVVRFDGKVGDVTPLILLEVLAGSLVANDDVKAVRILLQPHMVAGDVSLGGVGAMFNIDTASLVRLMASYQVEIGRINGGDITIDAAVAVPSRLLLLSGGLVQANQLLTVTGAGNDIVVVANQYRNMHGVGALNAAERYLVYSQNPADDIRGEVAGFVKRYNRSYATYAPDNVLEAGNVFFYEIAPIIQVRADDATRLYGTANPAFNALFSGFIDGDDATHFTGLPEFTTLATQQSGVGDYVIAAALGNLVSEMGYQFQFFNSGTLSITPAPLLVKPADVTRTYGVANPAFVIEADQLMGWDNLSVITAGAITTVANQQSGVGDYLLQLASATASNYAITIADGTLSITPAPLLVKPADVTRTYGVANPAFVIEADQLMGWDNLSVITAGAITTVANQQSGVGDYLLQLASATASNYAITIADGTLSITPAPLLVKPADVTRTYGVANPAFVIEADQLMGWDNLSVITAGAITTVANQQSGVGDYLLQLASATASNYAITIADGTLSITPAELTVTIGNGSRLFGEANPAFRFTLGGLLAWDDEDVFSFSGFQTAANSSSVAGQYNVSMVQPQAFNYSITLVEGVLTILPLPFEAKEEATNTPDIPSTVIRTISRRDDVVLPLLENIILPDATNMRSGGFYQGNRRFIEENDKVVEAGAMVLHPWLVGYFGLDGMVQ